MICFLKKLIANQGEKMEMKQKNRPQKILLACAVAACFEAGADDTRLAPVVVVGSRDVRDLTAVEGEALREASPGTSPLKLIDRLPGAMWTGADNLGDYEWANDLTMRGFGLN